MYVFHIFNSYFYPFLFLFEFDWFVGSVLFVHEGKQYKSYLSQQIVQRRIL
ncbi:hypothetical protein HanPSC8_Chr16g0742781 [Helianthus annuus]|nr:hypothetical protein HanPSC8_Chr16g0742781 [Helianthus annuus]